MKAPRPLGWRVAFRARFDIRASIEADADATNDQAAGAAVTVASPDDA